MRSSRLLASLLLIFGLLPATSFSQTVLDMTQLSSTNLTGGGTLIICPGNTYNVEFVVTSGQINPFAVVNIRILDLNNGTNPLNGSVVGTFNNGGAAIAGPSAPIPTTITIPDPIAVSDYGFYITCTAVTPTPAESDTTTRNLISLPVAGIFLDTTVENTYLTGPTRRLLSNVFPLGPTADGTGVIPPTAQPVPDVVDSTVNFCAGDTLYLWNPDSLTADEHQWLRNGALVPGIAANQGHLYVTESGYYSLVVTKANTCKDSVAYIGVGDPDPIFGATFPRAAGVYFNAYLVDTTMTRVGPGNAVGSPTRFCHGDSVVLSARENSSYTGHPGAFDGFYNYWWVKDFTDTISNNFSITVKEAGFYQFWIEETIDSNFTCKRQGSLQQVLVDPLPAVNPGTLPAIVCYGDTLDLMDLAPYEPSNFFNWSVNGTSLFPIYGDTNYIRVDSTTLFNNGVGADSIANFVLTVTDTLGCDSVSMTIPVSFVRYPRIVLNTADSIGFCVQDSVTVVASTNNGIAANFDWYEVGTGNLVSPTAGVVLQDPGQYYVEAVGPNGCTSRDTVTIFNYAISGNATANGTPITVTISALPDQEVTVNLAGSGGVSYYWYADIPVYFNNIFSPTPTSVPTGDTTMYYLQVTGPNGCTDLDSVQVIILRVEDPNLAYSNIQNLITPNGDGINDFLDLSTVVGADGCDLQLLNRWGTEVYFQEGYVDQWNGQNSGGDALPDGTYYYLLTCGEEVRLKGAVTIFRNQN